MRKTYAVICLSLFLAPIAVVETALLIGGFIFWQNPLPAMYNAYIELFCSPVYRAYAVFCTIMFLIWVLESK